MKRLVVIIFIVSTVFGSAIYAANEIQSFNAGATTCFAVVRELDGDVWYVSGQVFEAWGTSGRDADHYDIALTDKTGGMFVGSFDTNISAGYYHIVSHQTADATPDDADPATWAEYGYWDGDEWFKGALFEDVNGLISDMNDVNDAGIADAVWDELSTGHVDAGKAGQQQWTDVDAILADTGELQTDWTDGGRLDLLIDAIKAMTDLITILDTTVKAGNDANNFTLTDGIDVNDALWFHTIMVIDADDSHPELRAIDDYLHNTGSDPNILVDMPFGFTPTAGDVVHVMGTDYNGYLYEMWNWLRKSNAPIHYINTVGSRQGVRHFDPSGEDP